MHGEDERYLNLLRQGATITRPWAPADPAETAHVDCGSCRACCYHLVVLTNNDPDPSTYETDRIDTPRGPLFALKRKPDRSCIYLGPDGCTIYGRHPEVCRHFDCGGWWLTTTRYQRRQIKKHGDTHDRQMLASGRLHCGVDI